MFVDRKTLFLVATVLTGCNPATYSSTTQSGPTPSHLPLDVPGTMETKMTRVAPLPSPTIPTVEPTIVVEISPTPESIMAKVVGTDPNTATMPVFRGIENQDGPEAFAWVEVDDSVFVVGKVPGYGSWVCIVGVDIYGNAVTGFMDWELELQGVGETNMSEIPDIRLADCQ